jgi:hypothetical protein
MPWNQNNPFGGNFGGGGFGGQGQGGAPAPAPAGTSAAPAPWAAGQPVTGGWGEWANSWRGGTPPGGWQDATRVNGQGLPPGIARQYSQWQDRYGQPSPPAPAPGTPPPAPAPAAPQANGPPGTWNNFAYDGMNNPVSPLQQILFR